MKQLFTYLDTKAEGMMDPWVSDNAETAMRRAQIDLRQQEHLSQFAVDFTLMVVGTWDPQSGIERTEPQPVIRLDALLPKED